MAVDETPISEDAAPWPALMTELQDALFVMAGELLATLDKAQFDNDADMAAHNVALLLAPSKLRDGHFRAIRAHYRAIERNLGRQWLADYLEALWREYEEPLQEEYGKECAEHEERAWDVLKRQMRPSRRRDKHGKPIKNFRERVEEGIAE
jgi:hypothetical protein